MEWIPVWESTPNYYEAVLVSYVYHDGSAGSGVHYWRGAGHQNEDNTWSIYGECDEMSPFSVVAWMEMPDPAYAILEQAKVVDMHPAKSEESAEHQCNERRGAK